MQKWRKDLNTHFSKKDKQMDNKHMKRCSTLVTAAAAAKSLQSCPTLCDPIDGSPPGSSVPGILQARTLDWVAISFSNIVTREMQIKTTMRNHFTSKGMDIIFLMETNKCWQGYTETKTFVHCWWECKKAVFWVLK